jgi:ABC-type transporter Mla subunit MlaD
MPNVNQETLLLIFVAATGAAVLLQALVLLAMYVTLRKSTKAMQAEIEELRGTVTPVLSRTKEFLDKVGPQLESVATDLAELAHGLRAQSAELQESASAIMGSVRRQTSRLDAMCTDLLDTADRATQVVSEVIQVPLRQISAVAAFTKALVSALRTPTPRARTVETHVAADRDMFV